MTTYRWLRVLFVTVLLTISANASSAELMLEGGVEAARQGYYDRAAKMLTPLAKDGNGQAQFNLGLMYHSGLGVSRNEAEAVRLYHAAAKNGYAPAQEYLAVGYSEGWFGLKKDADKAGLWQQRLEAAQ